MERKDCMDALIQDLLLLIYKITSWPFLIILRFYRSKGDIKYPILSNPVKHIFFFNKNDVKRLHNFGIRREQ